MTKKFIYVNTAGDYEESAGAYEVADHINSSAGVGDAGKPIVLNADGKIDPTMISFDSLTWKEPVRVASVANLTLTGPGASIDGVTLVSGDRVLVKNQTTQSQNGIYVFTGAATAMTRATDFDEDSEVVGGVVVVVEEGSTHADQSFVVTSDNPLTVGTSSVIFGLMPFNTFSGGNGIIIDGSNVISVDLLDSGSGLIFAGGGSDELAINFASTFTIDAADALAIQANKIASTTNGEGASIVGIEDASAYYAGTNLEAVLNELEAQIGGATSSTFNFTEANVLADNDAVYAALEKLDLKHGDYASVANGEGSSLIGIEDAGGYFTGTNVEAALQELGADVAVPGIEVTTDGTGVTKGDLVYFSGNNIISSLTNISTNVQEIGLAAATAGAAATVKIANDQTVLTGVLTGATAGVKYYWTGSAISATQPTGSGAYVFQVGYAKNATDLFVDVQKVKKNA